MRNHRTLFGILAAALLLAAASYAGLKPSANATRQEVESDTTLAVKGILDIESGGALKFAGSSFDPASYALTTALADYAPLAGASFTGVISAVRSAESIPSSINFDLTDTTNDDSRAEFELTVGDDVAGVRLTATANGITTANFNIDESGISMAGLARLVPVAAPPVACAAGTEGGLYLDSGTHLLCVCNATAWVQVADGTTGCS